MTNTAMTAAEVSTVVETVETDKICVVCHKPFTPKRSDAIYCDRKPSCRLDLFRAYKHNEFLKNKPLLDAARQSRKNSDEFQAIVDMHLKRKRRDTCANSYSGTCNANTLDCRNPSVNVLPLYSFVKDEAVALKTKIACEKRQAREAARDKFKLTKKEAKMLAQKKAYITSKEKPVLMPSVNTNGDVIFIPRAPLTPHETVLFATTETTPMTDYISRGSGDVTTVIPAVKKRQRKKI